jgi:hypothetical protein
MKTYRNFVLTAVGLLLLGMALFLSVFWVAYGWEEATNSVGSMIIAVATTIVVIALVFRRRLKYLDSKDWIPPAFKDSRYREYGIDVDRLDFDQFKQFVEADFVISGLGDNTLKFRRKFTLWAWGAGAFLHYDRDAGKIIVHYFPISGYTRHGTRAVRKMDKSLEELIRRSLNS